jgi:hypothetical protein
MKTTKILLLSLAALPAFAQNNMERVGLMFFGGRSDSPPASTKQEPPAVAQSFARNPLETTILKHYTNQIESFTTSDGKSFTNVNIVFASLAGVTWVPTNTLGGGRIPLEKIPTSTLDRLGLTPELLADARQKIRSKIQTRQAQIRAAQIAAARLKEQNEDWRWRIVNGQTNHTYSDGWATVRGKIISVKDGSYLIHGDFSMDGTTRDRFFLLHHAPGNLDNDDKLDWIRAKYIGIESYRSVLGALETVRAFDYGIKCDPPGMDSSDTTITIVK